MSAEFGESCVVQFAIKCHIALDLWAGVQAVQDVALQVRVDGVALLQPIQRDTMEWQRASHILRHKNKRRNTCDILFYN